jgi:hypothetical protein
MAHPGRSKSMSRVFTGVNGGNGEGSVWNSPFPLLPPVSHRDWLVPGCRTGLEPRVSNQPVAGNAGITPRLAIGHCWPGVPDPGRSAASARGLVEGHFDRGLR